jgi:hypothetical protein
MSYPSNRNPREREHGYFEDDEQERGVEGRSRSYGSSSSARRPGERDWREGERFGERRYLDPYSGRSLGRRDDERERDYTPRQQGYAPYPYGEEPPHRNLEDWQRPWQLGGERPYGERGEYGPQQRSYESRGQSYRGRGPKGYQRSDERLREDICERLTEAHDIDASDISVEVSGAEVTLSGSVPDRRMKRAAEDMIEECSGVKQVHNALRIDAERERYAQSPATRH